jgi:hypothetical protein
MALATSQAYQPPRPMVQMGPPVQQAPAGTQPGAQVTPVDDYQPVTTKQKLVNLYNGAKGKLTQGLNSLAPSVADTSMLATQLDRSNQLGSQLGSERLNFTSAPGGPQQIATGPADEIRARQTGALDLLTGAATGAAPSAAVIAGQNAADRAAAQQFGLAAALGGRTPGAALRTASMGSAGILNQNAADMAAARAAEMATARQGLVQGLQGVRGQDQQVATDQAQIYNDWLKSLLNAQVGVNSASGAAAGASADAAAKQAASENAYKSSPIGAGVTFLRNIF